MTTLYIDRKGAEIDVESDTVVVRIKGERCGTVPLKPLERVVVSASAKLSTRCLARLAENGTGLLIISGSKRAPSATLMGQPKGDTDLRIAQYALINDEAMRAHLALGLVQAKITAQLALVRRAEEAQRRSLTFGRAIETLTAILADLSGASPGRSRLRGLEGAAAAACFEAFTTLFPASLNFNKRTRRPPRDPVNACLSLGYTLLHFEAVREAAAHGLDPMVGAYHDTGTGKSRLRFFGAAATGYRPLRARTFCRWQAPPGKLQHIQGAGLPPEERRTARFLRRLRTGRSAAPPADPCANRQRLPAHCAAGTMELPQPSFRKWTGSLAMAHRKPWIIAYDIASPGRLQRVHKFLSKRAFALQYSVFAADLTERELEAMKRGLLTLIDEDEDDVRFYAASVAASGTPLVVPLSDWSTGNFTLIESILRRPSFSGFTEANLRAVAGQPGVVFMFDSWNELGGGARRRARTEIQNLRAELPAATFIATTRPGISDVPFDGQLLTILELSEQQQMEIARVLRGQEGVRIVDEVWRTPGVRELVTIPLYLTALLSLPNGQPFPKTKEEILRRFVQAHEQQPDKAEPLQDAVKGLQTEFMSALAVTATHAANTSISEFNARRSIAQMDDLLVKDGQLAIPLHNTDVLTALVSHHVLVRTGDPAGYSFQHQQFQEWYASNDVERVMLESVGNADALQKLKGDILNLTPWEEPILFAVERMARGDQWQQQACGVAIVVAFEVDPTLAAEMIFRATDAVLAQISELILKLVQRWHTPGKLDRSMRFMIASGRPEFRNLVWPLITNENDQISFPALRAARRFRPSVLGPDAAKDILALPSRVREIVVSEIAYRSSMDGLDLAVRIAKSDPDPELKAAAVEGMSFRRADSHVTDVLSTADDDALDLIYRKSHLEEIDDEGVQERLAAARARAEKEGSDYARLRTAVYSRDGKDHGAELTELVATIEIERKRDAEVALIYEACKQHKEAVAQGLLTRLREGRELFYGADDILAASGIVVEDDSLLEMVLSPEERMDSRAEAAASILGPASVGKLIDAKLAVYAEMKKLGRYEKRLSDRYYGLRDRIAHAPGASLVSAVEERAVAASNEGIRELAKLLCRRYEDGDRARPFPQDANAAVSRMVAQWGEQLIASGDSATRDNCPPLPI